MNGLLFTALQLALPWYLDREFAIIADKWPLPDVLRWVADRVPEENQL